MSNKASAMEAKATDTQVEAPTPKAVSFDVLGTVHLWRSFHGVTMRDYAAYTKYCNRKSARHRAQVDLTVIEKEPTRKKKVVGRRRARGRTRIRLGLPETLHPTNKYLIGFLAWAERSWSKAKLTEHRLLTGKLRTSSVRRKYMRLQYRRARRSLEKLYEYALQNLGYFTSGTLVQLRAYLISHEVSEMSLRPASTAKYQFIARSALEAAYLCKALKFIQPEASHELVDRFIAPLLEAESLAEGHLSEAEKEKSRGEGVEAARLFLTAIGSPVIGRGGQEGQSLGEDWIPLKVGYAAHGVEVTEPSLILSCQTALKVLGSDQAQWWLNQSFETAAVELTKAEDEMTNALAESSKAIEETELMTGTFAGEAKQALALLELAQGAVDLIRDSRALRKLLSSLPAQCELLAAQIPLLSEIRRDVQAGSMGYSDCVLGSGLKAEIGVRTAETGLAAVDKLEEACGRLGSLNLPLYDLRILYRNCKALYLALLLASNGDWEKAFALARLPRQRTTEISVESDAKELLSVYLQHCISECVALQDAVMKGSISVQAVLVVGLLTIKKSTELTAKSERPMEGLPALHEGPRFVLPKGLVFDLVEPMLEEEYLSELVEGKRESIRPADDSEGNQKVEGFTKRIWSSFWKL